MSSTQQLLLGEGAGSSAPVFIEDVFSTYLYVGNNSTQTITNGIDLSTKGGLIWIKDRTTGYSHSLVDTVRGVAPYLQSNTTGAQAVTSSITSFNSNGFSINASGGDLSNANGDNYVSWTFRKQPKFFDIVTWTGDSTSGRTVAHNLGSVPGSIIVKCTSAAVGGGWPVYHRSLGNTQTAVLNETSAAFTYGYWNNTTPTSTVFTLNGDSDVNGTGKTYVAYLFAHDAGGFGLTGTDNVISCGTFVTGSGGKMTAPVNLGYEVQWLLVKNSGSSENWQIYDTMRGMSNTGYSVLYPNLTSAEYSGASAIAPNATGFDTPNASGPFASFANYIYVAIRRGPMAVPTVGTSVYKANTYTGNATANTTVAGNFGFPVDLMLLSSRSANSTGWSSYAQIFLDRLRGSNVTLPTSVHAGETGGWSTYNAFDVQNSIGWGLYGADSGTAYFNNSGGTWVAQGFARAPNFFDEVCYSGTGSATTQAHNLGVVPELMIIKQRTGSQAWPVYVSSLGATNEVFLSTTAAVASSSNFNNTAPTASVFSVGSSVQTNGSGSNYAAWLFATCAGVSKVGSYTGTGTTLQINCGFTSGARFVLIKRTDSTGSWYVWDSSRGIVSGNDPYLLLNSTAAEVTNTDYIDAYSAGFEISSTAPAEINASGGTYIFLSIA